jgi:hypothetical protein
LQAQVDGQQQVCLVCVRACMSPRVLTLAL